MTSIPPGSGPILPGCPQTAGDPPTFFMDAIAQRNRDLEVGYSSLDPSTFRATSGGRLGDAVRQAQSEAIGGHGRSERAVADAFADHDPEVDEYLSKMIAAGPQLSAAEKEQLIEIVTEFGGEPELELAILQDFFETRGGLGRSAGVQVSGGMLGRAAGIGLPGGAPEREGRIGASAGHRIDDRIRGSAPGLEPVAYEDFEPDVDRLMGR